MNKCKNQKNQKWRSFGKMPGGKKRIPEFSVSKSGRLRTVSETRSYKRATLRRRELSV